MPVRKVLRGVQICMKGQVGAAHQQWLANVSDELKRVNDPANEIPWNSELLGYIINTL